MEKFSCPRNLGTQFKTLTETNRTEVNKVWAAASELWQMIWQGLPGEGDHYNETEQLLCSATYGWDERTSFQKLCSLLLFFQRFSDSFLEERGAGWVAECGSHGMDWAQKTLNIKGFLSKLLYTKKAGLKPASSPLPLVYTFLFWRNSFISIKKYVRGRGKRQTTPNVESCLRGFNFE